MRTTRIGESGGAAVEFAILLIPMLVILTGITEIGRAMYYYNTIAKSVRDATRLLSTQAPTDPDYSALKSTATCLAVYGNTGCSGAPLLPGLTTSMVKVCDAADASACPGEVHAGVLTGTGAINLVTVTVSGPPNQYTFESLAVFGPALFAIPAFTFGPIRATMRQIN